MKDLKQGNVRMIKACKTDCVITGSENQIFDSKDICLISGLPLENKRTIYYLSDLTGTPLWNFVRAKNFFTIEELDYTLEQKHMMVVKKH